MKNEFFFCYDKKVWDYLNVKGFKRITLAINPDTGKKFALYTITDELNDSLRIYKEGRRK